MSAAVLGFACVAVSSHAASAATFTTQQIFLLGSPAVSATAINDKDTIAGAFVVPNSHSEYGFVLQPGNIWQIDGIPTALTNTGAVTGYSLTSDTGFVWQNGTLTADATLPLGSFLGTPLTPVLNRFNKLAYSTSNGGQYPVAYAGQPGKTHVQAGLSPYSAVVNSINDGGVIAGYELVYIQSQPREVVFVGKAGLFNLLLSPNGGNVTGGFVNNAGQVAFTDGSLGYVYSSHGTVTFTPPVSTSSLQVQAINKSGRVVGVYTDTTQSTHVQRAFL
jgi:hypothetical protein